MHKLLGNLPRSGTKDRFFDANSGPGDPLSTPCAKGYRSFDRGSKYRMAPL
jgi:hypothetical protein